MLMNYLYLHNVAKRGAFAIEMYDFLYHFYSEIQNTTLLDISR